MPVYIITFKHRKQQSLPQNPVSKPTEKQLFSLLKAEESENVPTDSSIACRVFILILKRSCHQHQSSRGFAAVMRRRRNTMRTAKNSNLEYGEGVATLSCDLYVSTKRDIKNKQNKGERKGWRRRCEAIGGCYKVGDSAINPGFSRALVRKGLNYDHAGQLQRSTSNRRKLGGKKIDKSDWRK